MDRFSIPEMIAHLYEARVSGKFGKVELCEDDYAFITLAGSNESFGVWKKIVRAHV